MKIVILGDALATQRAGIHYYSKQLIARLASKYKRSSLKIVVPRQMEDLDLDQIIIPIRAPHALHLRWRQIWTIPNLLNKEKPDAVVELAHFGPFRLHHSIRRITVIHDLTPLTHARFHPWGSRIAHALLMPGVVKRSHKIIANSETTAERISKRFTIARSRIFTVYPDVDSPPFESSTLPLPYWPYFLAVGSLEPRKNHLLLLEAFEQFCSATDDQVQLRLVGGDQWKHQAFQQRLRQSEFKDRVIVHGHMQRSDLWLLYRHARALVATSIVEGFGLPLLEGMSSATPLIASDIPVFREIAGQAARFFAPADRDHLALLMTELHKDESLRQMWSTRSNDAYQQYLLKQKKQRALDAL